MNGDGTILTPAQGESLPERAIPMQTTHPSPSVLLPLARYDFAIAIVSMAFWFFFPIAVEDVYWSPQGRASLDPVILFGVVLLAGIGGKAFLQALGREFLRIFRVGKHPQT
jgi:hypothetical protein